MSRKSKQKTVKVSSLTIFRLYAPDAKEVKVAGDFNRWETEALTKSGDRGGYWETFLNLDPGEYQYKFVVDGDWQHDPTCVDTVCNPFGTINSVVRVK